MTSNIKFFLIVLYFGFITTPMFQAAAMEQINPTDASGKLIILHTNDLHSRLAGYTPELQYTPLTTGDDNTMGGFARIATIIKKEKEKEPGSVLVLDGGDFLMGTLFQAIEPTEGFQLPLMYRMGYDAVTLGNHEFDFGINTTYEIINTSSKKFTIPKILLANMKTENSPDAENSLDDLYMSQIIKPYHIFEVSGLRIGIFGILGYDATDVAPYIPKGKIIDPVKTAREVTMELRSKEKVDLVICLSHSGIMKNEKGEWEGEDVKLASKVKDIDIIISGHTHTYLPEPIMAGKTIIVQAAQYGACVGRLELNVENKEVELVRYDLIPVNDDIPGDPDIHRDIEYAKKYIRERILDDMGLEYNQAVVSTDFDLICDEQGKVEDSNLGPFLADAIRYYINTTEGKHTDMALIAAGVIRDKLAVGTSSIADIFRITSLGKGSDDIPGYPLSMVYVTGNELKKIIEVLLFAYKSSPGNYCYYSGIKVHFDPSKGMLRKVISIEMENEKGTYQPVDFSKNNKTLYSITANAYILEFVGMLKKMTFGIVKVYPKSADGIIIMDMRDAVIDLNTFDKNMQPVVEDLKTFNKEVMEGKEWMATYKFVSRFEDINGDGIPDVPELYKNPPLRVIPVGSNK